MKLGAIQVPPWTSSDYPSPVTTLLDPNNLEDMSSLLLLYQIDSLKSLHRYLPSNTSNSSDDDLFRMYEFKVRMCTRPRSHDWTDCPYAHPGEKARRRDPKKYHYSGSPCPDYRKGYCRRGDLCDSAHGVFECWLHPSRYRTQPCKDGAGCARRVCFFAHAPDQMRVVSPRAGFLSSPETVSPPMSPVTTDETAAALMRRLQLSKSMPSSSWVGLGGGSGRVDLTRNEYFCLPNTPTRDLTRYWDNNGINNNNNEEEEEVYERVESGRDLRVKMFEKLSKDNPLDRVEMDPDLGWVSDLVT